MSPRQSQRRELVAQSEIRALTLECTRVNGINMSQGVCDLEVPACVIHGAKDAMDAGRNLARFCFAQERHIVDEACERIRRYRR